MLVFRMSGVFSFVFCIVFSGMFLNLFFASNALSGEKNISHNIPFVESSPTIDGKIDEGEWAEAERTSLDNEFYPSENIPAIVNTEVLMMEDGSSFYIAFIAEDQEPENIRAFYTDRDIGWYDDLVGVVIDTFNDEKRAFQFFVNPLGVQIDTVYDDVTELMDSSWNAIWDSAGNISGNGYVVEMKIPLDQLRFSEGLEKQIWGLDLLRYYPRDKRHKFSNNNRFNGVTCYLCQLKKVQGFTDLEQDLNLRFVPTVTASYSEERSDPKTDEWQDDFNFDVGMDVRWGINQDTYLNATINPDFSQVEADAAQLNVNNAYSLYYSEKRDFFLEGADYFNSNASLVYTRNISSPEYGIKLTGKRDVHTYGLFFTNDENTNFIIPGNQGSLIASLTGTESRNTALRYRSDISKNINLGLILTDRRADNYSNTVFGLDSNILLGRSDRLELQLMKSSSEYPENIQAAYAQKAELTDYAYLINYEHDGRNWSWSGNLTEYGDDFRADMGYITRVDTRKWDFAGGYTWRFGPDKSINQFYMGGGYEKDYDEEGSDLSEELSFTLSAYGPMQSTMLLTYTEEDEYYNGKCFDEKIIGFYGSIRPWSGVAFVLSLYSGDKIDYYNTRLGELLSVTPQMDFQIGKHFLLSLDHYYEKMNIDGRRLYTTNLSDLRITYQFNVRSFLRATIQYSDTKRDTSMYIFNFNSRYKCMTSQILYSYKINPQTRFFIGYSDSGYKDDAMADIMKTGKSLFTKFSYAW